MPNANTIARAVSLPGDQMGASSTDELYMDDDTATDAIVSVAYDHVKNKTFVVRANGIAEAAAASNLTINLDAGDSTTLASNTTIFTSGALALDTDSTSMTWAIEATCAISSTDSKLSGLAKGWVNNTVVAQAIITESVEDLISTNVLSFKVSGTLSGSNAANFFQLLQLEVDVL